MQPDTGVKTVDQNLHVLFERALGDEPTPPPGDLAAEAMTAGSRLRRNRRLLAGGSAAAMVAALVTIVALNVTAPGNESVRVAAVPPVPGATTACISPTVGDVTSVAIYLTDSATDQQRLTVQQKLGNDPSVHTFRYESRAEAFEKFKQLWRDSPDFIKSVGPDSLPESYQVDLVKPAQFGAFVARFKGLAGVQDVVGTTCPPREGK
jgi:cell division transport system permease protein